jgi:hypothetical protein
MASPERTFSAGPAAGARPPSALDARLASLEDEATQLRAEVAALQEEIRWLTGQDEEPPGWLERGWVRASLLLTAVGMVALVSLPYLLHVDASRPHADPTPIASARPAPAAPRATAVPAPVKAAARDEVPAPTPARVRAPEVPEPARILSAEAHPGAAPRPRTGREGRVAQPSAPAAVFAPARAENP